MLWFFAGTSVALTLLVAILPLLGMDVYLHRRTQASTEGLKSRLSTKATALRDGIKSTLPSSQLVPGEVGLGGSQPTVLLGDELERCKEKQQLPTLREVDVIARAKPAQKLLLVKSLQKSGEIVAVTGDGVNDVPALQAADIGIAMGERGTRSAREVAAIILLDDNFRTIVGAIGEGRQLFENLQLSFSYLLVIHIPLVLTATLIPLAGYPLILGLSPSSLGPHAGESGNTAGAHRAGVRSRMPICPEIRPGR
jgi:magnesium-transporting ATPase (P-type)